MVNTPTLHPSLAAVFGHYGSDYVNELSEARHLNTIAVVLQGYEHRADEECILKIVDILKDRGSYRPVLNLSAVTVEPNVPFVEGEIDRLLRVLLRLDGVADRGNRFDEGIHMLGS